MGLYDAAKDALKVAQQVDNVELVQKLLDVQSAALDMQHQLQLKNEEILELKKRIKIIEERKKYVYEDGHKWLISPGNPNIKLCPTCLNRDNFESPLGSPYNGNHRHCGNCNNTVN